MCMFVSMYTHLFKRMSSFYDVYIEKNGDEENVRIHKDILKNFPDEFS